MNETKYFDEAELKRQLNFLHTSAAEYKTKFPERWAEDVKRLETALKAVTKVEEKPVVVAEEKEKKAEAKRLAADKK